MSSERIYPVPFSVTKASAVHHNPSPVLLPIHGRDVDVSRHRLVRKGDYVYGSFFKPESVDGYINGVNPGDREDVLGRFPFSENSVDEALDYAKLGARVWGQVSLSERLDVVTRFRDQLKRFQDRLARLISRETGKPLWEARQEVITTTRAVTLLIDQAAGALAPRTLEGSTARSDRRPRGVVGVLTPYCSPLRHHVTQATTAMIAGNAVVVKPSKFTPGVGQAVAELWDRTSGLTRGVYNLVQGPGTVIGNRLVQHPGLDALLFNGSFATAVAIQQLTADRPELPIALHCGGKGIAIVTSEAELDRAVYEVIVGAFLTAGQRYNSTGRVVVTADIYPRFIEMLTQRTASLAIDYALAAGTFMGPLISENHRVRYRRFGRQLTTRGHEPIIEAGNVQASRRGFYVRPAIYTINWENGHPVLATEPPGPTLLVYRVSSNEEAAALHNQCAYRLSTSVFAKVGGAVAADYRRLLRTGSLNINRSTISASLRLPSDGIGRSSNGVSGGLQLFSAVTYARAQLTEDRPFSGLPKLPGTNWHAEPSDYEVADTDEEDLSSSLELTNE